MARYISKSGLGALSKESIAYQHGRAALRGGKELGGVAVYIEGDERLMRELMLLAESHQRQVVRPAVSKALTPIKKAAKRKCPVRYGTLKASIDSRVRSYSRANYVWGGVGSRTAPQFWRADKKYKGGFAKPYKYQHLVENGTQHSIARPHMRPAYYENKTLAYSIMAGTVRKRLDEYWAARGRGKRYTK